jgi:hypothetical protein
MPLEVDGGLDLDAGSSTDRDAGGLVVDAGVDGGALPDAGVVDAGLPRDAGVPDAGGSDGGAVDAGAPRDSGVVEDAGAPVDAGPADAGTLVDAGLFDAGAVVDAGLVDAGVVDAGARLDAGLTLPDGGSICGRCSTYGPVQSLGAVSLLELSGLAASRINPGILYAHNDSGGAASITIMRTTGVTIGELALTNATNLDWEDLAVGPCPTGSCIYVGEIGDNGASNLTYAVYRVAEPVVSLTSVPGTLMVTAERFELAYPNGLKTDAETLLVHPVSGDVYIVSKQQFGTKSSAYKAVAPLAPVSPNVMTRVAMLAVPDGLDLPITGGDIDPCGATLLLRSYSALYQFALPASATSFDAIFTAPFSRVPVASFPSQEPQGEAVCWNPGGGYFTASEGQLQQLHFVGCQ